uniref:Uncharacterized protein n=1 Tax=Neobodo designis TaxID=312471 RepID=A0A7S1MS71_NEODS|mmetsp:Transcript_46211/g.142507  ORF Transcript_46211/g.142507 Transcript_46211/m.142507 type:complete len:221 (+) Transcript_46211:32-694(+)
MTSTRTSNGHTLPPWPMSDPSFDYSRDMGWFGGARAHARPRSPPPSTTGLRNEDTIHDVSVSPPTPASFATREGPVSPAPRHPAHLHPHTDGDVSVTAIGTTVHDDESLSPRHATSLASAAALAPPRARWTPTTIREAQRAAGRSLDVEWPQLQAMPGVPRVVATHRDDGLSSRGTTRRHSPASAAGQGTQRDLDEAALRRRVQQWAARELEAHAAAQFW